MLSILIPTYNYNTLPLVLELKKQADLLAIAYEILVQDDCSSLFIQENLKINELENCFFEVNEVNLGRSKIRNLLAEKSKYEWILFLDCDVFPKETNFISEYIKNINSEYNIVYGGIIYKQKKPNQSKVLRWKYGRKRETVSIKKRIKKHFFLVSNILLKKLNFEQPLFNSEISTYGYEDLVFLLDTKKNKTKILHIQNETYHLELETSKIYLKKTETALTTLYMLISQNILPKNATKISYIYYKLKSLNLTFLINVVHLIFKKIIHKNIISSNPNLVLFDLYKLCYYATFNKK